MRGGGYRKRGEEGRGKEGSITERIKSAERAVEVKGVDLDCLMGVR